MKQKIKICWRKCKECGRYDTCINGICGLCVEDELLAQDLKEYKDSNVYAE